MSQAQTHLAPSAFLHFQLHLHWTPGSPLQLSAPSITLKSPPLWESGQASWPTLMSNESSPRHSRPRRPCGSTLHATISISSTRSRRRRPKTRMDTPLVKKSGLQQSFAPWICLQSCASLRPQRSPRGSIPSLESRRLCVRAIQAFILGQTSLT